MVNLHNRSIVAINGLLYYWYKGRHMGTPIAIVSVLGLLSSSLSFLITQILYDIGKGLSLPLYTMAGVCAFGCICGCIAVALTWWGEQKGIVNVKV
jgi:hypothetical protein